jgi:NTE family protein
MLLLSPPRLDPQELSHDNLPDIGRASQRRRRTGPLPVRTLRRLPSQTPDRRPLALALQGGGAHGALTWGVVDRLLQQPELTIAAISGSSAGALNALALAAGFAEGGAVGARAKLAALWHRVAGLADLAPLSSTSLAQIAPHFGIDWSPTHFLFETLTRYFSPYQFNPFGIDPLRQILIDLINIDLLRRPSAIRLYIGATQVDSGEARLFENAEITIDTILASACLPAINQAIRHNDTYYWDGGFSANPPVMPLVDSKLATDLIVVRVDPIFDSTVPVTADAIRQRLNRFMFNAPLNTELRLIDWLQSQAGNPDMAETEFGQYLRLLRLHVLSADDVMLSLSGMSKLRPDWTLIDKLHGAGLELAESWLNSQGIPPLGKDSTRPLHVQPETNQGLG